MGICLSSLKIQKSIFSNFGSALLELIVVKMSMFSIVMFFEQSVFCGSNGRIFPVFLQLFQGKQNDIVSNDVLESEFWDKTNRCGEYNG